MCMYVFVSVCEREKEKEKEREAECARITRRFLRQTPLSLDQSPDLMPSCQLIQWSRPPPCFLSINLCTRISIRTCFVLIA